ncbi:MAG TPA: helix-turn-helix transcriptional regulator [Casimicrobiaceae bacterium]|nr:helix-turn-helix transcriptional regulator [Casimicrobiaceae bacterium]
MMRPLARSRSVTALWEQARAGDYRGAGKAARDALAAGRRHTHAATRVEFFLIAAFCSIRQGQLADARSDIEAAARIGASPHATLRVDVWRAELAYFQGRYSEATRLIAGLLPNLEKHGDLAYVAFALRIQITILIARGEHDRALSLGERALPVAAASGDDYVLVQILNVLGTVHFDRATSKLREPHARAHLTALDPGDMVPMEADASEALRLFQRARDAADRAGNEFAAWYVAGNIERLEILLGRAEHAIHPIRKRLATLQARGAKYDEIVARSNLAWGLRTLGRFDEALHELDVAQKLARETGTANVLLEFLEYDRSIVLGALGDVAGARASYRRYLQLTGGLNRGEPSPSRVGNAAPARRPLEPYFLKRADRYISEHLRDAFTLPQLAAHCGVSSRTLEKAFSEFRGLTPVAHVRAVRLDHAHRALVASKMPIAEIAVRHGFRSPTTFALEYRKRFGMPPSRTHRDAKR